MHCTLVFYILMSYLCSGVGGGAGRREERARESQVKQVSKSGENVLFKQHNAFNKTKF